jgi:hypothetical protein
MGRGFFMKTKIMFLAMVIATLQTVALAQQQNLSTASTLVAKPKLQVFAPLNLTQPQAQDKIDRAGGMSSQPWTKIVGWHNCAPTFSDADKHEAHFCLVSFGAEPLR